jgi:hypothetical protein
MTRPATTQLYYGKHSNKETAEELRLLWTHVHTTTAQAQATAAAATKHAAVLQELLNQATRPASVLAPPPGSGPTDSIMLGLPVAPVDPGTLANGTKLTWNKQKGVLEFV